MEFQALLACDGGVSAAELTTALKISGCVDSLGANGPSSDEAPDCCNSEAGEAVADRAFEELTRRNDLYTPSVYPFELSGDHLMPRTQVDDSIYLFLRFLSDGQVLMGLSPDLVRRARKLFESLSALALLNYLGGKANSADAVVFGFPREERLPKTFKDALNELCVLAGEHPKHSSEICRNDAPKLATAKDDGLDVVVWRDFSDHRRGKLLVFGQCATGDDWQEKLCDMPSASKWCETWLNSPPFVDPVRSFFVPVVISDESWEYASRRAGILFDCTRIATLAKREDLAPEKKKGICAFNQAAIALLRRERVSA